MAELSYRVGNIFDTPHDKGVIIAHIVNDVGAFGAGFAAAIAKEWPHVRTHYYANFSWYKLGDVLLRDAANNGNTIVANLFAQSGLPSKDNPVPIKYIALTQALDELANIIEESYDPTHRGWEVWMPRIGTGYARGKWDVIEAIIKDRLVDRGVPVTVFDLPQ